MPAIILFCNQRSIRLPICCLPSHWRCSTMCTASSPSPLLPSLAPSILSMIPGRIPGVCLALVYANLKLQHEIKSSGFCVYRGALVSPLHAPLLRGLSRFNSALPEMTSHKGIVTGQNLYVLGSQALGSPRRDFRSAHQLWSSNKIKKRAIGYKAASLLSCRLVVSMFSRVMGRKVHAMAQGAETNALRRDVGE
jgi:hypothetical protein